MIINIHGFQLFAKHVVNVLKNVLEMLLLKRDHLEEGNLETRIIKDLCHGCTICMKDCSFNKRGYSQIKNIFKNN